MRDEEETRYKKKILKKPFGIESWRGYSQIWGNRSWYASERARDQALKDLQRKCDTVQLTAIFRKIDR